MHLFSWIGLNVLTHWGQVTCLWHHAFWSTLVQVMAHQLASSDYPYQCCQFVSGTIRNILQWTLNQNIQYKHLHSRIGLWKYDLQNVVLYVQASLSGIILGMGSANERRHYYVTPALIGRAHNQNDPWLSWLFTFLALKVGYTGRMRSIKMVADAPAPCITRAIMAMVFTQ